MEKEEKFNPSLWVVIRKGKKYIGCSNHCVHLEEKNGKMECCYFQKRIEGVIDNYQPCEECFRTYCETEFAIPDMTTYDSKNYFKE